MITTYNFKNADYIGENRSELSYFLIIFVDKFINIFINLANNIFRLSTKVGMQSLKKNYTVDTKVYKYGTVYNYIYLRYLVTILVPPLGIFLSKGILGWVNILVSFLFCYINYFIGIAYALIITYNSKYADLYNEKQTDRVKRLKYSLSVNEKAYIDENKGELIVMFLFLLLFIGLFMLVIYFK